MCANPHVKTQYHTPTQKPRGRCKTCSMHSCTLLYSAMHLSECATRIVSVCMVYLSSNSTVVSGLVQHASYFIKEPGEWSTESQVRAVLMR